MTEKNDPSSAPWQKEFFKNIEGFIRYGVPEDRARYLLTNFLKLSGETPVPPVMDTFRDPSRLEEVGVHTTKDGPIRDFMVEFLEPLMNNFRVEGKENLSHILELAKEYPITLISNHLSHLDAAAIYNLLYHEGGDARKLADSLVFIAGRLVFEPAFTRLGLYMIDSLLVCSKRDMSDNPAMADVMMKINMRAFRQSQEMQKQGKIIAIFPEGTRSRTGKLLSFVDTVYHYVANKIIVPISLSGTEDILPAESFLFQQAAGKLVIGKPILVGKLPSKQMATLPADLDRLEVPSGANKKQFIIDNLAVLVGQNLHQHRHGSYRNLYLGDEIADDKNVLIQIPREPAKKVTVIGHSPHGTAMAAIMANKDVSINIYIDDEEKAAIYNEKRLDMEHFPMFKLPPNITFTSDASVIEQSSMFVQGARPWEMDRYLKNIKEPLSRNEAPVVIAVKGFTGSQHGLISEDLVNFYGVKPYRIFVIAGANYPQQIMERKLAGFEMAANDPNTVPDMAKLFSTGYVFTRPAINPDDIIGMQLGSALKNIYGIATGLLDGYYENSLGGNSDSSLFHVSNRFFSEMTKIGVSLGGKQTTFSGLSGLTDLMLACFGLDAKDRQFGRNYIQGNFDENYRSSGYYGLQMLPGLIALSPEEYPIATALYAVVIQKKDPQKILADIIYRLRRF